MEGLFLIPLSKGKEIEYGEKGGPGQEDQDRRTRRTEDQED